MAVVWVVHAIFAVALCYVAVLLIVDPAVFLAEHVVQLVNLAVQAVVHAVPAVLAVLVSLKSNSPVVIKGKWEAKCVIQEPILKLHNLITT